MMSCLQDGRSSVCRQVAGIASPQWRTRGCKCTRRYYLFVYWFIHLSISRKIVCIYIYIHYWCFLACYKISYEDSALGTNKSCEFVRSVAIKPAEAKSHVVFLLHNLSICFFHVFSMRVSLFLSLFAYWLVTLALFCRNMTVCFPLSCVFETNNEHLYIGWCHPRWHLSDDYPFLTLAKGLEDLLRVNGSQTLQVVAGRVHMLANTGCWHNGIYL